MKVLWFTNTACSFAKKLNPKSYSGGWMESLEKHINESTEIQLCICYYSNNLTFPTRFNNTFYFPVLRQRSYLKEFKRRVLLRFNNDKSELQKLLEVVAEVNPDIIHIHGSEDNFGLIQNYVDKPVVISIQGIINPYVEKYFSGISMHESGKNESFKAKLTLGTQFRNYVGFKFMAQRELEILKVSKNIIGRTKWDRRVTKVLSQNSNYYHIDELLRDEFYHYQWDENKRSKDVFKIITTTTNSIYKGFETIIKTAGLLKNSLGQNFQWDIIGLSENDSTVKTILSWLKPDLKNINIKLHGKLQPGKFIPLMMKASVYCQTSHIENSPNSVCEAMLLGMPIIASFAGGTESMLENQIEGALVQDGDPFSLAGAIIELKDNMENANIMAKKARHRALIRHNPEKVVRELKDVYEKLLTK